MKRLFKILPMLLAVLFTTSSCIIDWDNENDFYDSDEELYDYVRTGEWYPASPSGLTDCEYNSHIEFTRLYVYFYDCNNNSYDSGSYDIRDGYLTIDYENGDSERYRIEKCSEGKLELRTTSEGVLYQYVRD